MKKEVQNKRFRNLTWLIGIVFFGSMLIYVGIENKEMLNDKWDSWFPEKEQVVEDHQSVSNISYVGDELTESLSNIIIWTIWILVFLMISSLILMALIRIHIGGGGI